MRAFFASSKFINLFVLSVWTVLSCARVDIDEAGTEHDLSLALSLKNVVSGKASTKMSVEITQADGEFRGLEHLHVIPFKTDESAVQSHDLRLGYQNVTLGSVGISQNGLVSNNNSHLFNSALIPNGMNHVLVYGKAPDEGEHASKDSKHYYGVLNPEGLSNPSGSDDISFKLEPILESEDTDELQEAVEVADLLLDQFNVVMSIMAKSSFSSIVSIFYSVKRENQILSCSYATFDYLINEIQSQLVSIPFESMELVEEIGRVSSALNAFYTTLSTAGKAFPSSYGIPEGSFGFWWNGNGFVRLINSVNIALVAPESYCYPPGLWYYANSAIKTSNNENIINQYTPVNEHWDDILYYYTDDREVSSFTESVAVVEQLQYGVSLLEVILMEPGAQAAELIDNCPLTGIIIGDQKSLDFGFNPVQGQSSYIYDIVSGPKIGTVNVGVNSLVLQTIPGEPVHFALEFRNNTGYKRRCLQGDILPRCKFYIAGILEPPSSSGSVFTKDQKTTVRITVEGLKNAYNTVPDLHDPQLEIGIVSEMKWSAITPLPLVLDF